MSYACPFAHRTRSFKGLENVVSMSGLWVSINNDNPDEGSIGKKTLMAVYKMSDSKRSLIT